MISMYDRYLSSENTSSSSDIILRDLSGDTCRLCAESLTQIYNFVTLNCACPVPPTYHDNCIKDANAEALLLHEDLTCPDCNVKIRYDVPSP